MPTMAKLISAILMAALGYGVADLVGAHLSAEVPQEALRPVTAGFGAVIGWRFLGGRVTGEWRLALSLGISAGAILAVAGLVWFSGYEMIKRAMRMAYGGDPFAALEDFFQIVIDQFEHVLQVDVVLVALLGSALTGVIATFAARRWR